jgi:DNA-binding beta-propeller fold protein YncE
MRIRPFFGTQVVKVLCLLQLLGLFSAALASANLEEVATFAKSGEAQQLSTVTGIAVTAAGTGGVPAGTIYTVSELGNSVARFSFDGEFEEAWGWGVAVGAPTGEFQRCGPQGEASHPNCKTKGSGGEGPGQLSTPLGTAVDPVTGNVYVLNGSRNNGMVQIFSADGSKLIGSFGERGALGETFDESPAKIHFAHSGGIAVDSSGTVYVSDRKLATLSSPGEEFRVMVFEPEVPGDFEHYAYSGRANDIANAGKGLPFQAAWLALDATGNLYVSAGEGSIHQFSPGEPDTATCEFEQSTGGFKGMAADPATGAVFYFSSKGKAEIHLLSPCNAKGEFEEVGTLPVTPKTDSVEALAFNPALSYDGIRPLGILYAGDGATRSLGGGKFEEGLGHIYAGAVALLPTVGSESVSSVGVSSATLKGQVNPHGLNTTYAFQYLTDAAYQTNAPSDRFAGATEAPPGGAAAGGGTFDRGVIAGLSGLLPDTEYHFRLVATNAEGGAVGGGGTFRTYAAELVGPPDRRAYELVSPAEKYGGEIFPSNPGAGSCGIECKPGAIAQRFPLQSTPSGDAIVYEGSPFSTIEGAAVYDQYRSERSQSGWRTINLSPGLMGSNLQGYKAFDADLSQGVLYQKSPTLAPRAPIEFANLYGQSVGDPLQLSPFLEAAPPHRLPGISSEGFQIAYGGFSADFSHQFFAANDSLTGATPIAPEAVDPGVTHKNLYEWSGGELRLVNVLPGNTESSPGAYFGSKPQGQGETSDLSHAFSEDGSRVFWSSETGQVYVRVDGDSTEQIPGSAKFLSASANGSHVLLTDGSLYDVDDLAAPPVDLTQGQGGFLGIVGQSEDLSAIYFVDTAVLTGTETNGHGAVAQPGGRNLYAWREGDLNFVASLSTSDMDEATRRNGDWTASPSQRTAEASPDGRWVAFVSKAPLTGYENTGPCAVKASGPCFEVFLYDSATNILTCPSCNPSGLRPLGESSLTLIPNSPAAEESLLQPRYLTDSGRLYFDTQDSLSPFDTNGGIEDVYQYEPAGVGHCARTGGCVSLISAGRGDVDSNFVTIDATGKSVFFTTRDKLVPADRDKLFDLYVAREGGGFPTEPETVPCQGEACQPQVSPPAATIPGSLNFVGPESVQKQKRHKKKHGHRKKAQHSKSRKHRHDRKSRGVSR